MANLVICCVVTSVVALLAWFQPLWLVETELWAGDQIRALGRKTPKQEDMVLIGIDDDSLNVLDILEEEEILADPVLDDMSFGFPYPRRVYGQLIEKLVASGVRLIVFDLLFPLPGEGDDVLKKAIEKHPGKVVIGMNISNPERLEISSTARMEVPTETVLEWKGPDDQRVGFVNFLADADNNVRSAEFYRMLRYHADAPTYHSLAMAALKQLGKEGNVTPTLESQHFRFMRMKVKGHEAKPYEPLPFYSIFLEGMWQGNYRGGEFFKDKIVFIGGTSISYFHDVVDTPEGEMLGPHLQMNVLAAALEQEFYGRWTKPEMMALIAVFGLLVFLLAFVFSRPLLGLLAMAGIGAAYFLAVVLPVYNPGAHLLSAFPPFLTFTIGGMVCYGYRFTAELFEKNRLRRTLERQMSPTMAKHILDRPENFYSSIPGQRVPVTILFSDIRGFTTRSENDDPIEVVSQLKEYLDAMVQIVEKHHGVVDKFIGDAVMAVWNPVNSLGAEKDARNAVAAAMEMHERLEELNMKWVDEGRDPFVIGIGLNFGETIFGQMGSEGKQELTVIGDPVNQAARLEGLTKKFGAKIIIGESVAQFVGDDFLLRHLGGIRTKGKSEAASLYSVVARKTDALSREGKAFLERYDAGLEAFRQGNVGEAKTAFEGCLKTRPGDVPSKLYLEEIELGNEGGVLVMREK